MFKLEEVKNFKKADLNLIKALKNELSKIEFNWDKGDIEEFTFTFNNITYALCSIHEGEWTSDDGKYEYNCMDYQLISFDSEKESYPCDDNTIDEFNILVSQDIQRTGSYYSDYCYIYEKPIISLIETIEISEQIIPAHEEIQYKEI